MFDVSVIIVSWETKDLLRPCLHALLANPPDVALEILVIDNGSTDGSADLVQAEFSSVELVRNSTNRGYAAAVNQGILRANGKTVLLLGSDTVVQSSTIPRLFSRLVELDSSYAAIAPQLLDPDGSVQPSCRELPTPGTLLLDMTRLWKLFPTSRFFGHYRLTDWNHDEERDVVQPQMSCLLLRREALESVGPLDADAFPLYFNDVDWSTRAAQKGLKIRFLPTAQVIHAYGRSTLRLGSRRRWIWRKACLRYSSRYSPGLCYFPLRLLLSLLIGIWALRRDSDQQAVKRRRDDTK